jgi:hypothetical protein
MPFSERSLIDGNNGIAFSIFAGLVFSEFEADHHHAWLPLKKFLLSFI